MLMGVMRHWVNSHLSKNRRKKKLRVTASEDREHVPCTSMSDMDTAGALSFPCFSTHVRCEILVHCICWDMHQKKCDSPSLRWLEVYLFGT